MSSGNSDHQSTYTLPSDNAEANRLDTQHEIFRLTFHDKLILSPMPTNPNAILDIGCGTSNWAIEVANLYPNTKVYGIDLGQPQPSTFPPNYTYLTANFEQPWPFEDNHFDHIHGRFINIGIRDHKAVISEAFRTLKPGGYFELQDFVLPGYTTVDAVAEYWNLYVDAAAKVGTDFGALLKWSVWLREAGFSNINRKDFEWPVGPKHGETDERMLKISNMMMTNYLVGLRGFSMGFLTRGLGWNKEKVEEYLDPIKRDLKENSGQTVLPVYVVYGQKPA